MYVGSSKLRQLEEYVANKDDSGQYYISKQLISSSPAILRIFVEALSNAIDNVERSKKTDTLCTYIKINIDKDSGETSISNDGDIVPIEKNEEENCYNHTMIFGQLLTGSNYDDEEEKKKNEKKRGENRTIKQKSIKRKKCNFIYIFMITITILYIFIIF